jgi:hypothetical protein
MAVKIFKRRYANYTKGSCEAVVLSATVGQAISLLITNTLFAAL